VGPDPARLLDLTRLVSRLGRGALTGVDRVELAYLRQFLADETRVLGLARTALGLVLLDRSGCAGVLDRAEGRVALGPGDLLSRLSGRRGARAQAEADLRRLALARAPGPLAPALLRRHVPGGAVYFNVGHSNLSRRGLRRLRAGGVGRIVVLVHDTIPLDHPEYCRADRIAPFRRKLAAVAAEADLVIHTTETGRAATERHLAALGRVPPGVVAGLGVAPVAADPAALPPSLLAALDPERPMFLCLGTIEPRKDHAFLLDLWQALAKGPMPVPQLVVAGGRGWADRAVLDRLDRLAAAGHDVLECPGLSDGAIAALMDRAEALVFPTRAEGYGLPAVEAAVRGCPIFCSPLPVFREILGDYPVYLESGDAYSWLETIKDRSQRGNRRGTGTATGAGAPGGRLARPDWQDHFNRVLSRVD